MVICQCTHFFQTKNQRKTWDLTLFSNRITCCAQTGFGSVNINMYYYTLSTKFEQPQIPKFFKIEACPSILLYMEAGEKNAMWKYAEHLKLERIQI